MDKIKEFLNTPFGKISALALFFVLGFVYCKRKYNIKRR